MKWNDLTDSKDPIYTNTDLTYPTTEELAGDSIEDWAKKQSDSILKAGDILYVTMQVSDGDLLSDGSLSKETKNAKFYHNTKQLEYLKLLMSQLKILRFGKVQLKRCKKRYIS